jgi:hypothetical protein
MKSPLYLTENMLGDQLPHVLRRWPLGLLSQKEEKKEEKRRMVEDSYCRGSLAELLDSLLIIVVHGCLSFLGVRLEPLWLLDLGRWSNPPSISWNMRSPCWASRECIDSNTQVASEMPGICQM